MSELWIRKQERFQGMVERCAPGGHRKVTEMIAGLNLPKTTAVLDVAAGSGAFLARIQNLGFTDLSAIELDKENFQLKHIPVQSFDLNLPFADKIEKRFDLITAVEIIEHLDNPRHLLRELRKLLKPDGIMVVTVPNAEHWLARLKFAVKGELRNFGLDDIHAQRHISPILSYQMEFMFDEIGFKKVRLASAGEFRGTLKTALYAPLGVIFQIFMKGLKAPGEMLIFIARRENPQEALAGGSSRYFEKQDYLTDDRL